MKIRCKHDYFSITLRLHPYDWLLISKYVSEYIFDIQFKNKKMWSIVEKNNQTSIHYHDYDGL